MLHSSLFAGLIKQAKLFQCSPNFLKHFDIYRETNMQRQLFSIILHAVIEIRTGDCKKNPPKAIH